MPLHCHTWPSTWTAFDVLRWTNSAWSQESQILADTLKLADISGIPTLYFIGVNCKQHKPILSSAVPWQEHSERCWSDNISFVISKKNPNNSSPFSYGKSSICDTPWSPPQSSASSSCPRERWPVGMMQNVRDLLAFFVNLNIHIITYLATKTLFLSFFFF